MENISTDNKIVKRLIADHNQDGTDIHELIYDCTHVMVTYALDDRMRMQKVVTFFDKSFGFEEVSAGQGEMMRLSGNISLYKTFMYSFGNNKLKKLCIQFFAVLLKTIKGFTFKGDYHDCRKTNN